MIKHEHEILINKIINTIYCEKHNQPLFNDINITGLNKHLYEEFVPFLTGKEYYRLSFTCIDVWIKLNKVILIHEIDLRFYSMIEDTGFLNLCKRLKIVRLNIIQ